MHPDAEKALTKAWYAVILDLYSTALMSENTTDRLKAAEILLDYTIRLGQSLNPPFVPTVPDVYDDEDGEEEDD